jgi:alpha-tubulin suppressor-like RCC1 family protein
MCALSAGQLRCWGSNAFHQLGVDSPDTATPVIVAADKTWTEIAAGDNHTCGISNANVYCWGDDRMLQGGTATGGSTQQIANVIMPSGAGTPIHIFAGGSESCTIDDNAQLICWGTVFGDNSTPIILQPGTDLGVVSVALANDHACVLAANGDVWCFGDNSHQQLSESLISEADHFHMLEKLGSYDAISVRDGSTCGVTEADMALECWGTGDYGLFNGMDPPPNGESFLINNDKQWASVRIGSQHACAIDTVDEVYCWGEDTVGATGEGLDTQQTMIAGPPVFHSSAALALGGGYTCAIDQISTEVFCWGANSAGQLGTGTIAYEPKPKQINISSVTRIAVGRDHTCAIANGSLLCWGRDDGTGVFSTTPTAVMPQVAATTVSAGYEHTCITTSTGTLHCFGGDSWHETPDQGTAMQVSAGGSTTCTLTSAQNNNVTCYGRTPGETTEFPTAGEMEPLEWSNIAADDQLAIGVNGDKDVMEFGIDPANDPNTVITPGDKYSVYSTALSGSTITSQLAVGHQYGCALFAAGPTTELSCWGDNELYECTNLGTAGATPPVVIPSPDQQWARTVGTVLAAADFHTCAISAAQKLYCWGDNGSLALGDLDAQLVTPTEIEHPASLGWAQVATGSLDTCAIDSAANLYCWGSNVYGEVGNGGRYYGEPVRTVGP